MDKLICCICPTYNRPYLLGRSIACFERQSYENRYLIIVDDAGQYDNQKGDRWEVVSFPRRILTLGEKNNICAALAPRDTFAYCKWDDDDIYLPWHIEAHADAYSRGTDWVQPDYAIDFWDGEWVVTETFGRPNKRHKCYHGCWSYTRELFEKVGGYRARYAGDDGEFQTRLYNEGYRSVSTSTNYPPSYIYNRPLPGRISEAGGSAEAYWDMDKNNPIYHIGRVPTWVDTDDLNRAIPGKTIARPW